MPHHMLRAVRLLAVITVALLGIACGGPPEEPAPGDELTGPSDRTQVDDTVPGAVDEGVYADALAAGWENYSWGGQVDFAVATPRYEGTRSLSFTVTSAWGALYLHRTAARPANGLTAIRFAALATRTDQRYSITAVDAEGVPLGAAMPLGSFGAALGPSAWVVYDVPLSALGANSNSQTSGFWIQDVTGASQPALYLDDVRYVAAGSGSTDAGGGSTDAGSGPADAGSGSTDAGSGSADAGSGGTDGGSHGGGGTVPAGWLYSSGNHLRVSGGTGVWHARGANLPDTRSCDACTFFAPSTAEVNRRADELISWGANFIRLDMESYASSGGRTQWANPLQDPAYVQDLATIVSHIGTHPGVYVMVSVWVDPTITAEGWPSAATGDTWAKLAQVFASQKHVLFGVVNEPQNNYDGAQDAQVWTAMNDTVARIRAVEASLGVPNHVVVVQGTGGWARRLGYYVTHPITAGGGRNIAYEVHVYDAASQFNTLFVQPSQTLPVIIGEFGPAGTMSQADAQALMDQAETLEIPWLAWTFHMRCSPNMLTDFSGGGCGVGMALAPTSFGTLVRTQLASPY